MVGLVCVLADENNSDGEAKTAITLTLNSFGFMNQREYSLSYPGAVSLTPIYDTATYHTNGIRSRRKTKYPYQCYARDVVWYGERSRQKSEERKELFRVYLNEFEDSENNNVFMFPTMVDVKEGFRYYKRVPPKTSFWFCTDWKG